MRKIIIHLILILLILIAYFLQSNFFNWFTIAGIMPNLFIMCIVFIGLFGNKFMGITYGIFLGFFIDYIFRTKVGISAISFGIIGIIAKLFDKNFSKDSRITIMLIIAASTVLFETLSYFAGYVVFSTSLEIMPFIKITLVETLYNVILTVILYPLIQKFGYYVENTYKETPILTKYF